MKKIYIGFAIAGLLFSSCNFFSKNEKYTERDYDILNEQDIEAEMVGVDIPDDIPAQPQIVRPDVVDNRGSIDIYKYADQDVHVEIPAIGDNNLTARIIPADSSANVRFEEILLPVGRDFLPFGREINYNLPQEGIYTLIIRADTITGMPWKGTFTLNFHLR